MRKLISMQVAQKHFSCCTHCCTSSEGNWFTFRLVAWDLCIVVLKMGPFVQRPRQETRDKKKEHYNKRLWSKRLHLSYTWHVLKHLFSGCYLDIIRLNCRYKYTQHCHFGDTQLNPVKVLVTNNLKPLGRLNITSAPARVSPYLYFSVRRL